MDREPDFPNGLPSATVSHSVDDSRQSRTMRSPPELSELTGMETVFTLSPPPMALTTGPSTAAMTQSCGASDRGNSFDVGMAALQSHSGDSQQSFASAQTTQGASLWSESIRAQAVNDDFEHYTFQGTAPVADFPPQADSNQSSPRSWKSAAQFRPVSWEAAPEPLQTTYGRQYSYLARFQLREGASGSGRVNMDRYIPSALNVSSTSLPTGASYLHTPGFDSADASFDLQGQSELYGAPYSRRPLGESNTSTPDQSRPLSPYSSTLDVKVEDDKLSPCPDESFLGSHYPMESGLLGHSRQSSSVASPTSGGCTPGTMGNLKTEEPYAKLIYRAFMSTPRHSMTLQEIYQWFRENTDKGKTEGKGWQNSIRHNLSMNKAFTKRDRHSMSSSGDGAENTGPKEICLSTGNGVHDSKKSSEWFLQPWAVEDGVQSTTRYRKPNTNNQRKPTSNRGSLQYFGTGRDASDHRSTGRRNAPGILTGRISSKSRQPYHRTSSTGAVTLQMQQYNHRLPQRHPSMMQGMVGSGGDAAYDAFLVEGARMPGQFVNLGEGDNNTTRISVDFSEYTATSGSQHHIYRHQQHPSSGSISEQHHQGLLTPSHHHPHHHHHNRTPSESAIDEPVTPEPTSYVDDATAASLLLPDLRSSSGPSSSSSMAAPGMLPYFVGTSSEDPSGAAIADMSAYSVYDEDVVSRFGAGPWGGVVDSYAQHPY
ncbi:hypothetical protein B0H63DRAFT_515951 [Podospora didyma]|uniref:Fork-head domain-containing protein n=1 Tax=Podospora didyma TaxID=330526 RepID=A0AAE0P3E5_9PEZI|nr:hypothetical protein B0H63DRAFT_515951 [Podospora didyma]